VPLFSRLNERRGDQWQFKKAALQQQQAKRIVEETLKPGASVSPVARAQDVNANQLAIQVAQAVSRRTARNRGELQCIEQTT